jgi:hypothetical protein
MKRNTLVFLVLSVCLMGASAYGQARSSNPPQGAQTDAARLAEAVARLQAVRETMTEVQVQRQLQDIAVLLQRAQQLKDNDRVNALREAERALALMANRRMVVRPSSLGGGLFVQVAGGAWWTDAALVARLGLTEDQRSRIERAFTNHRLNLEASRANLEKEEAQLARLLDTEPLDRNAVTSQIFRVTNARGDMERENAAMTLEMREQMTLAQWNLLQTLQPRATIMVDVPVTPGAQGPGEIRQIPFPVDGGARGGGGRGQRGQ